MTNIEKAAEHAVDKGKKLGADQVEAFIKTGEQTTVKVYGGEVELFTQAEDRGAGVRVLKGDRTGYAYSTALDDASLDALVHAALENAAFSQPDANMRLPEGLTNVAANSGVSLLAGGFDATTSKDKIEFALAMEKAALGADKKITSCEDTLYADGKEHIWLVNSEGFRGDYLRGACFAYTNVLASDDGAVMSGFSIRSGSEPAELDPVAIGEEAAERATMLLGSESIKPRRTTVIFDPLTFIQILMSITPSLSADAVQKGRSFLAGKTGEKIASESLAIVDDGRMPGGLGTAPFDDEGVATRTTKLVEDGILTGLLYNSYSARKDKTVSTGNASRASYKTLPGTSPTNLYIRPGNKAPEDIFKDIDEGLYIVNVQGLHAGVNAVSGQFSVGAGGMTVKNGRPDRPVREITIASTLPEILKNVVGIGDDLMFVSMGANVGSPTIAVEGITAAGR